MRDDATDDPVVAADIVNLGFVINVIEDFDERLEALTRAWSFEAVRAGAGIPLQPQHQAA